MMPSRLYLVFFFKGMTFKEFNEYSKQFSVKIDAMLRDGVKAKIKTYIEQGYELAIVSASIENWIKPWALVNNIEIVIGTQIEVDKAGVITGKFSSPNCIRQEKVDRFLAIFPNRNKI